MFIYNDRWNFYYFFLQILAQIIVLEKRGLFWNSIKLCDCNGIWTHNHLARKQTLHHLANWSVWLNGWVFVYELSDCGIESRCNHLNFRYRICFKQGDPWHSGNYRVWFHSETRTWHDTLKKSCSLKHVRDMTR